MKNLADAQASMNEAQALLDQVQADNEKLAELVDWLTEAVDRSVALGDYIGEGGQDDLDAVLAADPAAVTPPVANQDAGWDAMVEHSENLMRLLRVVTAAITAELDAPSHCSFDPSEFDGVGETVADA